ncbi:MAG: hypothetical protein ACLQKA_06415 [Bryobacteraceae bacterium]
MQLVQFTLYEIFGYAFPGATGLLGMYLLYWTFALASDQEWRALSPVTVGAGLAVAYVFGHFLQACTNPILRKREWRPEYRTFHDDKALPPALRTMLIKRACDAVGIVRIVLEPEVIYDIADHDTLQRGKTEARDIYVYREGFYRGMTGALLLFGTGCLFRMAGSRPSLIVSGVRIYLERPALLWTSTVAIAMAVAAFFRYQRFARYRVKYAFYSLLTKGGAK